MSHFVYVLRSQSGSCVRFAADACTYICARRLYLLVYCFIMSFSQSFHCETTRKWTYRFLHNGVRVALRSLHLCIAYENRLHISTYIHIIIIVAASYIYTICSYLHTSSALITSRVRIWPRAISPSINKTFLLYYKEN